MRFEQKYIDTLQFRAPEMHSLRFSISNFVSFSFI